MATTTCNIRMDARLKAQVDAVAEALGLSTSAVFNVFARKFVAHNGFPFEVVVAAPSEAEYAAEMERRYAEVGAGMGAVHELIEERGG